MAAIQDTRPTVIFAYTIKGHGLASEGHPQNHSSLLTKLQLDQLAQRSGMSVDAPWARFPDGSQVTLAAEGRAHQSITTASVGLEQPGYVTYEPAFALDVEWTLLASMARLGHPDGCSAYLRLSTRPVDQSLAAVPTDPAARERRRAQVVAGAYVLHRSAEPPAVTIAALGALIPEAMAAVEKLAALDVAVDVVCLTSPHLLFSAMQSRDGRAQGSSWILDTVFPVRRAAPMVTVLGGHPHTLAFLAASTRSGLVTSASPRFGQSGDLADMYRYHPHGHRRYRRRRHRPALTAGPVIRRLPILLSHIIATVKRRAWRHDRSRNEGVLYAS